MNNPAETPGLRVLSLGAGVQSSTMLLMACEGLIERPDCAIFADTGWEPGKVYRWLKVLEGHAAAAGIPLHRVAKGNLRADLLEQAAYKPHLSSNPTAAWRPCGVSAPRTIRPCPFGAWPGPFMRLNTGASRMAAWRC
jgi:3'-phosphoadenosine 5'-phosphosulfate sulfotransferase (PAPS reductase)/FAD synthetase